MNYKYIDAFVIQRNNDDGTISTIPMVNGNADWDRIKGSISNGSLIPIVADPLPLTFFQQIKISSNVIRTTDATPTEVYRATLKPITGYDGILTLRGIDTGNGAIKIIRASVCVKRLNAGALMVGNPIVFATHPDTGAPAWTIAANVAGNDFVVTATGAAGRTIDWRLTGDIETFTPGGS